MTGRAAKRSSHSIRTGDVAPVGRAIDDQQINPEQVAEVDEMVDLGRGDNSVCCGSPAVIQDSAEAARLGSGSQTDSDRMTLWSG